MSLRLLEPWERRLLAEMEHQGRRAAQDPTSECCSLSPLQLSQEIKRLKTKFHANWRRIAYPEGHLRVADARFRDRRHCGASLRGRLETARTKSLKEWL